MKLQDELKKINEFFEDMSIEEFDTMLVENGVECQRYNIDSKTTFSYKKYDECPSNIQRYVNKNFTKRGEK